ncbi:NADP-dependent oxidoreductase [Millisia brevis]|uniref:NADP-dependent oxidoreductase n=1 Tax=Millisia brevis TaxID=264148 RepID=UPI000832FE16|nr:NADP-dependent oxidoreductase [Millisia brevis]
MRAIVMDGYGGPEALRFDEDYPAPQAEAGQILIRVHASSVNPGVLKRAGGALRGVFPDPDFPYVPGSDFSGVVAATGPDVTRWNVGDQVYSFGGPGGSHAELTVADAGAVSRKPDGVSHGEAASLALAVQTAALVLQPADLRAGRTLAVLGAGGAVGNALVQLAHLRDIDVIAVASARSLDRLKALGGAGAFDSVDAVPEGVDAIVNALGPQLDALALRRIRRGGHLLTLNAPPPADLAAEVGVHARFVNALASRPGPLDDLHDDIDAGRIAPFVGRTFRLEDTAAAWALYASREIQGKIVIDSSPEGLGSTGSG